MPPIDLLNADSDLFFHQLDEPELADLDLNSSAKNVISNEPNTAAASTVLSQFDTSTPTDNELPTKHTSIQQFINESFGFLDQNIYNTTSNNKTQDNNDAFDKIIATTVYRQSTVRLKLNDFVCINKKKFGVVKFQVES